MTDLWTEASCDAEADTLHRHLTTARVASAAVWPFLAASAHPVEYTNRKALSADRIDRIAAAVADGDPALFSVVRASLEDGFDADFAILHADRVATAAARREQDEAIRATAEREALEQILANDVWDEKPSVESPCTFPGCRRASVGGGTRCSAHMGKEASKTAFDNSQKSGYTLCKSCKHQFRDTSNSRNRCPKCSSSDLKSSASKTAAEYAGGSPKEGDTARCHKDGGAIQFFDGQWMHLKGTAPESHNDVYPPNKDERNEVNSSLDKTAATMGERATCAKCDTDIEFVGTTPDAEKAFLNINRGAGWWDRGGNFSCSAGGTHVPYSNTMASKRPALSPEVVQELQRRAALQPTLEKTAADDEKAAGWPDGRWIQSNLVGEGDKFESSHDGETRDGWVWVWYDKTATRKQAEFPPKKDGNPFGGGHEDPAKPKDDPAAGGSWKCPACGSANAFTQGGIELADALSQKQPIQCGDCKQIDQTGGQQAPDPGGQQPTAPAQVPPHHGGRLPFAANSAAPSTVVWTVPPGVTTFTVTGGVGGGGGGGTLNVTAAGPNPYAGDANPYVQPGTPDDQMDGPQPLPVADAAPPESTRPRVMPQDPTPPPVAPAPAMPAGPPAGDAAPPEKKAAGLGFTSAAFKTAERCPATQRAPGEKADSGYGYKDDRYTRCTKEKGHPKGECSFDSGKSMPAPTASKTAIGDDPCPAMDEDGGSCTYREGHDAPHRFEGGDDDARHQKALDEFKKEKS